MQPHGYAKRKCAGDVIEGDISPELCRFGIKKRILLKRFENRIGDVGVRCGINTRQIHRAADQGDGVGGTVGCETRGLTFTRIYGSATAAGVKPLRCRMRSGGGYAAMDG